MKEQAIFLAALDKGPAERAAFLDQACGGDDTLRRGVETLLRLHAEANDFLDVPAVEQLAAADPGPGNAAPDLSFLAPSSEPGSLGRLDHYEVLEVVGRGGMGVVLRARDTKLLRVVALKVLTAPLAASGTARQRFVREARASAAVRDDHVVADDASLTQSGIVAGTPLYMAPEQATGAPVDHRSDLFSLGSVLYELCTGRPAFRAPTTVAVIRRVCDEVARPVREVNPDVPGALCRLIEKLHAKKPADRPASAKEVADSLAGLLSGLQGQGQVALSSHTIPPPAPPRRAVPVAALGSRSTGPADRRVGPGRSDRGDECARHRDPPVLAGRHAGRGGG